MGRKEKLFSISWNDLSAFGPQNEMEKLYFFERRIEKKRMSVVGKDWLVSM